MARETGDTVLSKGVEPKVTASGESAERLAGAEALNSQEPTDQEVNDGFHMESGSVSFTEPPADTTSTPEADAADEAARRAAQGDPNADEQSASADGQPPASREATPGQKTPSAKKKQTVAEREAALTHGIDKLTYELRKNEGLVKNRRQELADLDAEIEAKRKAAGLPPKAAVAEGTKPAPAAEAAKPVRPTHPKYRDFDTDEAYEAAVAEFNTAQAAYEDQLVASVKADLSKEIDGRFEKADTAQAAAARSAQFTERKKAAIAKYPDWSDRAAALADVQSSWYDAAEHGTVETPFLSDLAFNHEDGAEFMYWLGGDPAKAQILADLEPTRALRDGLLNLPSVKEVMDHFASPDGLKEWDSLSSMHPLRVITRLGALYGQLTAAPRGPAAKARPITNATAPVSHRPGVAAGAAPASGAPQKRESFEEQMAREDQEELDQRLKAAGLSPARAS